MRERERHRHRRERERKFGGGEGREEADEQERGRKCVPYKGIDPRVEFQIQTLVIAAGSIGKHVTGPASKADHAASRRRPWVWNYTSFSSIEPMASQRTRNQTACGEREKMAKK